MKKINTRNFGIVKINEEKNAGYINQHSKFFENLDKKKRVVILTHMARVNDYALLKSGDKIIPVENFLEAIGHDISRDQYCDYEDELIQVLTSHNITFKWEVRPAMGDEGEWSNAEEFFGACNSPENFGSWAKNSSHVMAIYCLNGSDRPYRYVGEELANDNNFFREVISQPETDWQLFGWGILKFAGEAIKDDEELVLMAISRDTAKLFPERSSLHFASERLRGEENFCRKVIEIDDRPEVFWAMEEEVKMKLVEEKFGHNPFLTRR